MKFFGLLSVIIVGSLLLSATKDFPNWGDEDSPANEGPVSSFYIEKTEEKTKVPNMPLRPNLYVWCFITVSYTHLTLPTKA